MDEADLCVEYRMRDPALLDSANLERLLSGSQNDYRALKSATSRIQ
jgi:hypothetical protein